MAFLAHATNSFTDSEQSRVLFGFALRILTKNVPMFHYKLTDSRPAHSLAVLHNTEVCDAKSCYKKNV